MDTIYRCKYCGKELQKKNSRIPTYCDSSCRNKHQGKLTLEKLNKEEYYCLYCNKKLIRTRKDRIPKYCNNSCARKYIGQKNQEKIKQVKAYCKICKKELKIERLSRIPTYCSAKCQMNDPDIKEIYRKKIWSNKSIQEKKQIKQRNTIQQKYGVDNISQVQEIKDKKSAGNQSDYFTNPEIRAIAVSKAAIKKGMNVFEEKIRDILINMKMFDIPNTDDTFKFSQPFGAFVPDFINHHRKIIIQCYEHYHYVQSKSIEKDKRATEYYLSQGYDIMIFSSGELSVNSLNVYNKIHEKIFG